MFFNFYKDHFVSFNNIYFVSHDFYILSKKSFPNPRPQKIFSCILNFDGSGLTYRSIIGELIILINVYVLIYLSSSVQLLSSI